MSISPTAKRTTAAAALALTATMALSSCIGGPKPVGPDDIQTATIQIEAVGTFVQPLTLDPVPQGGRGSGFFISPDGIAVTNNHVVTGAGTLDIWVGGDQGKTYGATVLGASECLDLAVIKVDGSNFPFMDWYTGEIKPGVEVYSAGFPLGDPNFTLTRGIVSKADVPAENQWASLDHVIEHDARIRGGNSGGPLVSIETGRVVGVNYAGYDELDYNYAIHRDQVEPVLEDLIAGKAVQSLGINAEGLPPLEDGTPQGVWVTSVKAGGPADKIGITPGDQLLSMGGVPLAMDGSLEEYCQVIRTQGNDSVIDVELYRASDDSLYEGQFNGEELVATASGGSTNGGEEPVGSFVTVEDDSGVLSVSVPDTWSQVDGASITTGDGVTFEALRVSPDVATFETSWSVPGVALLSSEAAVNDDIPTWLETLAVTDCTLDSSGPYDDSFYVGEFNYYTGCAGGTTDYVVIAAKDVDNTHLMLFTAQLVSEADKATVLDELLNSFIASY